MRWESGAVVRQCWIGREYTQGVERKEGGSGVGVGVGVGRAERDQEFEQEHD